MGKKRVLLIGTGSFVCAKRIHNSYKPQPLTVENLYAFVPEIKDYEVDVETLFRVDPADIMPEHWAKICERIEEVYKNYDGIVIHQGVDTMHYSAAALSFMILDLSLPIVFTGALVPPYLPNSDARKNIADAVKVAAESNLREIAIVFDGLIMRGNRCVKASDQEFTSFFSTIPVLGNVDQQKGIRLKEELLYQSTGHMIFYSNIEEKVSVIKLTPGMPPEIIPLYQRLGYKGLIIESFSAGNVPIGARPIIDVMQNAIKNGMFIVLGSQSIHGFVKSDDPNAQMGSFSKYKALQVGAIPSEDMTTEAALTKLMWLIGNFKNDLTTIRDLFLTNVAGEITDKK